MDADAAAYRVQRPGDIPVRDAAEIGAEGAEGGQQGRLSVCHRRFVDEAGEKVQSVRNAAQIGAEGEKSRP